MKRALILGGGGFVGRYLAARLRREGWHVTVTGSRAAPEGVDCDESAVLDILDGEAVAALLERCAPDALFHLAAQSSAALSWKEPALTVDVNIKGTVHLLEAARKMAKPPRILLVGSSEEYGSVTEAECPIREEQTPRPGNIYAASKVCQEMIGSLYARAYGLDVLCTRSFNLIGPGQAADFVISDFCRQTALLEKGEGEAVIRVGNLSARRDFTDVRDVVRAYVLLMEKGETGAVYNVGRGEAVAVREMLDMILSLSPREIRVEVDESRFRPIDAPLNVADTRRLREATGWTPEIPLRDTVRDTLNFWRKNI